MKLRKHNKIIYYRIFPILFGIFLLLLYLAIISEGSEGGEDSFSHFKISKYSFKHPELFLDQWGKPVFVLLSSPFSQFGFIGIKIFNILFAISTAYVTYLVAKKFKIKNPVMSIFFLCFAPMYFVIALSGLTEILFGFILILSIYLFLDQKIIISSIIISFLPFARSEGILFLLVYLILLFFRKKYSAIPFCFLGIFLYNLIGFLHKGDYLWVINYNPYLYMFSRQDSLYHYVINLPEVIGIVLCIFLIIGFLNVFYTLFISKNNIKPNHSIEELFLIYGSFLLYLVFHSFILWKGLFGVWGSMRKFSSVMPLTSIICLNGYNSFIKHLLNTGGIKKYFNYPIILLVILMPFIKYSFPIELNPEQKLIKDVVEWYKSSNYTDHKIYYRHSFLSYALESDPWGPHSFRGGDLGGVLYREIPLGSIIIWDNHFGTESLVSKQPVVPLDFLKNNKMYKLLKIFKAPKNNNFEVYVFQRIE